MHQPLFTQFLDDVGIWSALFGHSQRRGISVGHRRRKSIRSESMCYCLKSRFRGLYRDENHFGLLLRSIWRIKFEEWPSGIMQLFCVGKWILYLVDWKFH